jgi:hypothetical protein
MKDDLAKVFEVSEEDALEAMDNPKEAPEKLKLNKDEAEILTGVPATPPPTVPEKMRADPALLEDTPESEEEEVEKEEEKAEERGQEYEASLTGPTFEPWERELAPRFSFFGSVLIDVQHQGDSPLKVNELGQVMERLVGKVKK